MNKVRLFSNYASSSELLERFLDNYNVDDDSILFTVYDDYDWAVIFNKTHERIKDTAKILTFIQEPTFSPAHFGNNFLIDSDILVIHDQEIFEKTLKIKLRGEIIEHPSFMWFHDHVNKNFFDNSDKVKKKKKLSMVVSNIYMSVGNYVKRIELVKKIIQSDLEIDIFGRGLELEDPRYKGELEYKFAGLLPYEYSIAIENSCEPNYLTEKFIDPVLCNTTPIYYGAPNVNEIYPTGGFELIDLNSPTIIEDIKSIINKPRDLVALKKSKEYYFDDYNLYLFLKKIICSVL